MDASKEEGKGDDADDRNIYLPFLRGLAEILETKKDYLHLEQVRKAEVVLQSPRQGNGEQMLKGVRRTVRGWYNALKGNKEESEVEPRKSEDHTQNCSELSSPKTASTDVQGRDSDGDKPRLQMACAEQSPIPSVVVLSDETSSESSIVSVTEVPSDKECSSRKKRGSRSCSTTSEATPGTSNMPGVSSPPKVTSIEYMQWKLEVIDLQPFNRYDDASTKCPPSDPRRKDNDVTVLPSPPPAGEAAPVMPLDNLNDAIKWLKEKMDLGNNVRDVIGSATNAVDCGGGTKSVDDILCSSVPSSAAPTKEDGGVMFYRDSKPFHELFQPGPSEVASKLPKPKKKQKQPVAKYQNSKGDILIDVEAEDRLRQRQLARQKAAEEEKSDNEDESPREVTKSSTSRVAVMECHKGYEAFKKQQQEEKRRKQEEEKRRKREEYAAKQRAAQEAAQANSFVGGMPRFLPPLPPPFLLPQVPPFGPFVPPFMAVYPPLPQFPRQVPPPPPLPPPPPPPPPPPRNELYGLGDKNGMCCYCPFAGNSQVLMSHYVNHHQKEERPVRLPLEQLRQATEVVEGADAGARKPELTGIKWLDDLTWIKQGQIFMENESCKLCDYSTKKRILLIQHMQGHRKAYLKQLQGTQEEKNFRCRFCQFVVADVDEFFEHCTGHTGDFSYGCGHCVFRGYCKEDVATHYAEEHSGRPVQIKTNKVPCGSAVFGYACTACGFVQLARSSTESHVRTAHVGATKHARVFKLNMSREAPRNAPVTTTAAVTAQQPPIPLPSEGDASESLPRVARRPPPVKVRGDPRFARQRNDPVANAAVPPTPKIPARPSARRVSVVFGPRLEDGSMERSDPAAVEHAPVSGPGTVDAPVSSPGTVDAPVSSPEAPSAEEGPEETEEKITNEMQLVTTEMDIEEEAEQQQGPAPNVSVKDEDSGNVETSELQLDSVVVVKTEPQPPPPEEEDGSSVQEPVVNNAGTRLADTITTLEMHLQLTLEVTNRIGRNNNQTSAEAVASNWSLRRLRTLLCNCGFVCSGAEAFGKHRSRAHKTESRIGCTECGARCDTIDLFVQHFRRHCPRISLKVYVCWQQPLCRFLSSKSQCFLSHLKECHSGAEWFLCFWCGKQYSTTDCLLTHVQRLCPAKQERLQAALHQQEDGAVYPCADCEHESFEREEFVDHVAAQHPNKKDFRCKQCPEEPFPSLDALLLHLEHAHRPRNFSVSRFPFDQIGEVCKVAALSCQVTNSDSVLPSEISNWLATNGERRGRMMASTSLRAEDPVASAVACKSGDALQAMLQLPRLVQLYKCGGAKNCSFTTDNEAAFGAHLRRRGCRLVCLYCGEDYPSVELLLRHVTRRHGASIHQCAKCLFRSRTKASVIIHAKAAHGDDAEATMVACQSHGGGSEEGNLLPDLLTLVPPVICTAGGGCDFVSMVADSLQIHLRERHPALLAYECFFCSAQVPLHQLEEHLARHDVHKFHCHYCGFGTAVGNDIVGHLSLFHPHRPGHVFIRKASPVQAPPDPPVVSTTDTAATEEPGEKELTGRFRVEQRFEVVRVKEEPRDDDDSQPPETPTEETPGAQVEEEAPPPAAAATATFSCGSQNCSFGTSSLQELERHVDACASGAGARLCCRQCLMLFRNKVPFLNHILSHQASVSVCYYCGLCSYKAQLPHFVKSHLGEAHGVRFDQMLCVRRYPDGGGVEFVYERRTRADEGAAKPPPTTVGDIGAVPPQSIFPNEVACGRCDYRTKVRTNLLRHLEKHDGGVALPPAPAATSTSERPIDPGLRLLWHPSVAPAYVAKRDRFRCCADNCDFVATDNGTYGDHVANAHPSILEYPCPHCGTVLDVMANLIRHLDLHGPNLYRCPYCTYVNIARHLVLGHGRAEHPGVPNYVTILREEQELDIGSQLQGRNRQQAAEGGGNMNAPAARSTVTYLCPLCKTFRSTTTLVMKHHLYNEINYKKFSCNLCKFGCVNRAAMQEHLEGVHPGHPNDFTVADDEQMERLLSGCLEMQEEAAAVAAPAVSPPPPPLPAVSPPPPPRLHCPMCNDNITKKALLATHLRKHLQCRNFKCQLCAAPFTRLHHLRRHHDAQHRDHVFQSHAEVDSDIPIFINWVVGLVRERVSTEPQSAAAAVKPWSLTCKSGGCTEHFTSLKTFYEHFKGHLRSLAATAAVDDDVVVVEDTRQTPAAASSSLGPRGPRRQRKTMDDSILYMCPLCDYQSMGLAQRRHLLLHYNFKFHQCLHCDFQGVISYDVHNHCQKSHPDATPKKSVELPRPDSFTMKPVGSRPLLLHPRRPHDDANCWDGFQAGARYRCRKCEYASSDITSVRRHCQNAHDLAVYFRCFRSDAPTTLPPPLVAQEQQEEAVQPIECTMCDDVFPNKDSWLRHFEKRHGRRPNRKRRRPGADSKSAFRCTYCSYSCRQTSLMTRHCQAKHPDQEIAFEKVEDAAVYRCPRCDYNSTDAEESKRHILSHLRPFRCGLCPKKASTKRDIECHSTSTHPSLPPRVVRNPEYERERRQLLSQMSATSGKQNEFSVENVRAQNGLEFRVLSVEPSTDPLLDTPPKRRAPLARKSTVPFKDPGARKRQHVSDDDDDAVFVSHYGKRPKPADRQRLTVFTNFRGMRNARTTVAHFAEIFCIDPIVVVRPLFPS